MELAEVLAAGPSPGNSARLVALVRARPDVRGTGQGRLRLDVWADPGPTGRTERRVTADQTNASVVVGDTVRVKWIRPSAPPAHRAVRLLDHLRRTGFAEIPRPFAIALVDGVPVAFVDAYLPEAEDGWDWCPAAVLAGDGGELAADLGRLTARLHVALATATPVLPRPVHVAGPAARRWHAVALSGLADAEAAARRLQGASAVLGPRVPHLRAAIDLLADAREDTAVQAVHGDLHVGQVLRWRHGLAVVDFDGNPVVVDADLCQPAARDVAQMLCSIDHVARVVEKRAGGAGSGDRARWAHRSRRAFLDAYRVQAADQGGGRLLDEALLRPFMAEQECREIVYAARHLERWGYAPVTTIRSWVPDPSRPPREPLAEGLP